MNAFGVLTRSRLLETLHSPVSTSILLAFPIVLMLVVGGVFWNGHPFERRHVVLALAGLQPEEVLAIDRALAPLEEIRIDRALDRRIAEGKLRSRMASAVVAREPGETKLSLLVGPRDVLFGRGLASALGVPVELRTLTVPRFGYVHFLFPGVLSFSVVLSGLLGMGHSMARYRQSLFLKKLATTPLSRTAFVMSQITARALLVLLQTALLVVGSWLVFDMTLTATAAAWLSAITLLGLLTFMGAGFALACVIHDESTVMDVISTVNIPLVFLSELFFLLDELPRPLAWLGEALPTTHMVRLVRQVLLYGADDAATLLPSLAVLGVWVVAGFGASFRLFRWHES